MSDKIGRITVPTPTDSGSTFPLVSSYGYGMTRDFKIITHRFGSEATMGTQRFGIGSGARRFQFVKQGNLSLAERTSLLNFYNAVQGSFQTFLYPVPNADRSTFTTYKVIFDTAPLSIQDLTNRCQTGITFTEIVDPTAAPVYPITSTCVRFPSGSLTTGLLGQVQEIIPLIHIQVRNSAVPDIYLSDRRVTVGGQLYLPRVLNIGEAGSDVIMSQSIDGRSDNVRFTFGNADRAMSALAKDCSLKYAEIDLSLFHVNTTTLIQLWKGVILSYTADGTGDFPVTCSDGLYPITQAYPPRTISRQCWKTFNDGVHCPWATTAGHTGNATSCDYFFNSPNGCLSHGMSNFFGGHPAFQQSVVITDRGASDLISTIVVASTSIISDSIWGSPLPEIWCNDGGTPQQAFWANAQMAAVRDESTFEDTLGILGVGPIGMYEGMSVQTTSDGYKFVVAPESDGFPPQGFKVNSQLQITGYQPTLGLREVVGNDPCHLSTTITDGTDVFSLGQGTPQRWDVPDPTFSNIPGRTHDIFPYAAGTAFVELRYAKDAGSGVTPTTAESHTMIVPIAKGLTGVTFDASDTPTQVSGLVNPFWVAANTYLRALGLQSSSSTAQLAAILRSSLVKGDGTGCAEIADTYVAPIVGVAPNTYQITTSGMALNSPNLDINNNSFTFLDSFGNQVTETISGAITAGYVVATSTSGLELQFQFQGTLSTFKPFRAWLEQILNCCLGYYVFEFGKLKLGIRWNAVPTSAFTIGNMLYQSLSIAPAEAAFEYLKITFANVALQYQQDMVEYQDKDHAAYFGRPGNPLTSTMNSPGLSTLSQGLRVAATRVREEIGGTLRPDLSNQYIEFDNANLVTFKSTILALETEVGQVISVTHPDLATYPGPVGGSPSPANTWPFRIQKWQLHKDWSLTIQARSVTDSMYDLEVGPVVTSVLPPALPILFFAEPLGQWAPFQIQANSGDALFPSEYTFDLAQVYTIQNNGYLLTRAVVYGTLPVNTFIPNCGAPDVKQGNMARATTGGSLPGNSTYYIQICATNASGACSAPSEVLVMQVPIGTNTNQITLSGILWPSVDNLTGYTVYASDSEDLICAQQTGTISGSALTGYTPTTITIDGPFQRSTSGVPNAGIAKLRLKGKRLIHGGVLGAGVDSLTTTTITSAATIDTLGTDNWTGRVLAIIGRGTGNGDAPFANFNITGFVPSTGVFTIDRDPTAAGVLANDDFAVCFLGADNSSNPYVVSDAGLSNATNGHLGDPVNDPDRIGNSILVIKGKSGGLSAKIVSNTATAYTLDQPLPIDATSVWIVVTASWEESVDVDINNADPTKTTQISMDISNYSGLPVLLEVLSVDNLGNEVDGLNAPLRMLFVTGTQGTRGMTANGNILPTDSTVLFDTSGLTGTTDSLAAAITVTTSPTTITLSSGTGTVTGTFIQIDSEIMFIQSGGGTSTPTVTRGMWGTTAATHSNSATVHVPTALAAVLPSIALVPNQGYVFHKINPVTGSPSIADLNYVKILPGTTGSSLDPLPGGAPYIILADNSPALGTYSMKAQG